MSNLQESKSWTGELNEDIRWIILSGLKCVPLGTGFIYSVYFSVSIQKGQIWYKPNIMKSTAVDMV